MIGELRPYPTYRDSQVGPVPTHWSVRSLGSLVTARAERNRPDLPLLSVVRERGVILRSGMAEDENHNFIPDDLTNYKVVRAGNLVINKMKAWQGSLGVAPVDGIVSPAYFVFALQLDNLDFGHRLLRSAPYVSHFARASDGVRIGQWDLSVHGMKRIPVLIPPPPDQAAIVRVLGHVERCVARYIRAKQKLIALLNEQKQAVIHHAVTRGLKPSVPLKWTGIEYLRRVPAHWSLVQNRALLRLEKRLVGAAWGRYPLLSLTKRGVILRDMENPEGKFPTSFEAYQEVNAGDLIFCLFDIDETPRAVGLSTLNGMITSAYTRFACDAAIADWVHLFYLAMDNGKHLKPLYTGLRKVITKSAFLSTKMPLPPKDERAAILAWVESNVRDLSDAEKRTYNEITLLSEYRSRLVADVVTGKLDVREVALRPPPDADQPEGVDSDELDNEEAPVAEVEA